MVSEPLGTLSELRSALDAGAVSSAELVDRSLARAEAVEPGLHALLATREERRPRRGRRGGRAPRTGCGAIAPGRHSHRPQGQPGAGR